MDNHRVLHECPIGDGDPTNVAGEFACEQANRSKPELRAQVACRDSHKVADYGQEREKAADVNKVPYAWNPFVQLGFAYSQIFFHPFGFAQTSDAVAGEGAEEISRACRPNAGPRVGIGGVQQCRKQCLGTDWQHGGSQKRGYE